MFFPDLGKDDSSDNILPFYHMYYKNLFKKCPPSHPRVVSAVRKWKKKVEDECGDIPMVLVQNKIDLVSQSEIDQ